MRTLGRKRKEPCSGSNTSVITALRERRLEEWEFAVGKGQRRNGWGLALPTMCKAEPNVF